MQNLLLIDGISLKYYDAEFKFFNIKLMELYERKAADITLHSHMHYELHFITGGEYTFSSVGDSVTLKSGEFIVFPPEFRHYSAKVSENYDSVVIQFVIENKSAKRDFYDYFTESLNRCAFKKIKASKELVASITDLRLQSEKMHGIEAVCCKKAILTDIVYKMFKDINGFSLDGEKAKCSEARSDFLMTLDSMVNTFTYTLNDIAKATGYSTRNISRLILSIYKMPLSELKRKNSIDTAKNLLASEKYSVEEVAVMSGFKNSAAMRNAFRKYEGAKPSDYKSATKEN